VVVHLLLWSGEFSVLDALWRDTTGLLTLQRVSQCQNQSYFTVYRQSVHIGAKPLEAYDQFFLTEPLNS
jgi:hypothetical protein